MKKTHETIEKELEQLGDWLQSQPVYSRSEAAKEKLDCLTMERATTHHPMLHRSGWGLAACLLVGLSLWFNLTGPIPLTYAEVQASVNDKPWVVIQYQSGTQEWINLSQRQSFYTYKNRLNFYVGQRDHARGLYRAYHSNWGQQIHERPFEPHTYPQTPWEYAVGGWNSNGPSRVEHSLIEQSPDEIDGVKVIRFDTYDLGPLDIKALARTVWADPKTRLPVRICKYQDPERHEEPDVGDFSFPQTGPQTIYDLNAPSGLPTVTNAGVIDPAAKELIEIAKEKQQQLPKQLQIVEKSKLWLTISTRWDGQYRSESYGHVNDDRNEFIPLDVSVDQPDALAWARANLSLLSVELFDGQYVYQYHTVDRQRIYERSDQVLLQIKQRPSNWVDYLIGLGDQWPYTNNVGPLKVVETAPDLASGCILLQYETESLRRDWIIDTRRDNICIQYQQYSRPTSSDPWPVQGHERGPWGTDLIQLPSDQWVAQQVGHKLRRVALLTEDDMMAIADGDVSGFFNGEPLIEKTRAKEGKITFWAR